MYLEYFKLTERPFSITPDPRFLYMSARHREALAHLLYGLGEGGGFVQLTGEVGTGKTTICRCLLEQVPENVDIALVLNPKVTSTELIATVCDELGIEYPAGDTSIKSLTDVLNRYLLDAYARGRRTVLILDEAQNLSADVLEQVRLLTNLETSTQKLLQIVLIGQPELRSLLAREDMRQLSQRVTARYHLDPISREEAGAYIKHRLQICGTTQTLFSKRSVDRIQQLSGGIPRLINVLCDRSMLGAYVEGKAQVDPKVVKKAAREVLAEAEKKPEQRSWSPWITAALAVLVLIGLAVIFQGWQLRPETAAPAPVVTREKPLEIPLVTTGEPVVETPAEVPVADMDVLPEETAEDPAEEPAAVVEPESRTLDSLLLEVDSTNYRAAWTELFSLWSVDLPASVQPDFCDFAKQYGLLCMVEQGNWNTLRQFNRPVILRLAASDGRRVPVVLQTLEDSIAEVIVGNELYRLPVGQVEQSWYGDYTLLLQAPPGGRLFMKIGDHGPVVSWLRQQLELAQAVTIPAADPLGFDSALQKQVLDFQRSHGLVADGIVGKNTMIHLNTASGREGVPRLLPGSP
ncbi:MAG: AAA family ATPase [Gammaproteobacteria bacterium]|jgi:general secretion pathway protein A|nr:AAA family ATPase [Gammaproteobacteria bacterium]